MAYLIGVGYDVALEDMTTFSPQPRTEGLMYESRTFAASGDVYDELPYIEFQWDVLGAPTLLQGILSQAGLTSTKRTTCTVYIQNEDFTWVKMNGIAVRPFPGRDGRRADFFLRDYTILVHSLRTAA